MTFYGPDQVEAVKAAADLARVAERHVAGGLKRAGSSLTGRCPFHDERSPSFYVYPDDGHYHCFGCGAHGDVLTLVQEREGCSFQEAVDRLAREFGVRLEDRSTTTGPKHDHSGLYRACEFAAAFYERHLWGESGSAAMAYLAGRKLTEATLRRFRLGWAPGGAALCSAAKDQGITTADLQAAGLARQKDGVWRDTFWRRIVIPITNATGRPIAFSCRCLPDDALAAKQADRPCPKYVNSDETPLYVKGRTLFNLHRAKGAASKAKRLLVVEGALDVICLDQAGFAEAVAPCGTALTADQAQLIATTAARHDVYLAFDGDAAGQAAAGKGARALLGTGAAVRVLQLDADVDPAELLVEAGTDPADVRTAFAGLLTSAAAALPWLVAQVLPDPSAADAPARLRVFDDLLPLVTTVADPELRDLYVDTLALRVKVPPPAARSRARKAIAARASDSDTSGKPPQGERGSAPREEPSRYQLNELGNAHRFRDLHGDDVRYCHTWAEWVIWRGTHWEIDTTQDVHRRMRHAIEQTCDTEIAELEAQIPNARSAFHADRLTDRIDGLRKWREKNGNNRPLRSSIELAESLADLGCTADQFDADPWAFAVANGTIDLRTGILSPSKRDDYITRCSPVEYHPTANESRWTTFLHNFTGYSADNDSPDLLDYLQRVAGYAMTGITKEDAVWMFAGSGGNGKGTFTGAIAKIIGNYSRPMPFELFLSSHSDKRKWSLAEASQCRLVVCEESEEGRRFNASLVKQVSGGTPIEAERKNGHPFVYEPRFKVWFVTNHAPSVNDTDLGFWRRLHLVQCDHTPATKDPDLRDHLKNDPAARAAVLAWAVAGAKAYHQIGLQPPESVRRAKDGYRNEQDPLRPFLQECCMLDGEALIPIRDLMAAYDRWADDNKLKHKLSGKSISQRLSALGVQTDDVWVRSDALRKSVRGYAGIRLRVESDPRPSSASDVASDANAIRGESEATATDPTETIALDPEQVDDPARSASDAPSASDRLRSESTIRGDATTAPTGDLSPPASDASDSRAPVRARESPPLSLPQGRERTERPPEAPPNPTSRGARLRQPPTPDPADEDPFADPPPPDAP